MSRASMPRGRLRVALVVPNLEIGGTERHVVEVATRIDPTRYAPVVVCLSRQGALADDLMRAQIPVICPHDPSPRGRLLRWVGRAPLVGRALRFAVFLRPYGFNLLHAYLPIANVFAAFAKSTTCRSAGLIVSKRALGNYKKGRWRLAQAEKWANHRADAILVNSKAVAADVMSRERADESKIHLVYNGVVCAQFQDGDLLERTEGVREELGLKADQVAIGMIANLIPYKGHANLIRAMRIVAGEREDARLVLVGRDVGVQWSLLQLAEQLGISDKIIYTGRRRDIPAVLSTLDIQVHSSLEEGFSNAILEGMAAGRPVVVTDVGGNREAVKDGATGLVVPPGNPEALAEAILRLLRKPAEAKQYGSRARQRAQEQFDIARMISAIEELYEMVLQMQ